MDHVALTADASLVAICLGGVYVAVARPDRPAHSLFGRTLLLTSPETASTCRRDGPRLRRRCGRRGSARRRRSLRPVFGHEDV